MAGPPTPASFKQLIISALIVPIGMMICVAVVLIFQIRGLLEAAALVEQTDLIIANGNRLEKLMLDMETGLRGYLISGDPTFLDPFNHARNILPGEFDELRQQLDDHAGQVARLNQINALREKWLEFADETMTLKNTGGDYVGVIRQKRGKGMMDTARAQFRELVGTEEKLRDERSKAARRESTVTLLSVVGVTLLGGFVLSWLARKQFLDLSKTYENALAESRDLNTTLEARVTERTRLAEQRSSELAEANQELEAFAYSISHDLRAPMRHITGFSDLMRKSLGPELSPDDAENLDTIHDTAKRAGRMVDDLLGLSRLGRTQLAIADVDMTELVKEVQRELQPEAKDRNIHWQIDPLPPMKADRALIKLVLLNLVSNAIKYSSKNPEPRIEIGGSTDRGRDEMQYFVRDNGVGFDMEYASKLFGVFQRLHRAEDFEGTGIGLANVRRIILRHGGRVWAEGKLGKGATFFFAVPASERVRHN